MTNPLLKFLHIFLVINLIFSNLFPLTLVYAQEDYILQQQWIEEQQEQQAEQSQCHDMEDAGYREYHNDQDCEVFTDGCNNWDFRGCQSPQSETPIEPEPPVQEAQTEQANIAPESTLMAASDTTNCPNWQPVGDYCQEDKLCTTFQNQCDKDAQRPDDCQDSTICSSNPQNQSPANNCPNWKSTNAYCNQITGEFCTSMQDQCNLDTEKDDCKPDAECANAVKKTCDKKIIVQCVTKQCDTNLGQMVCLNEVQQEDCSVQKEAGETTGELCGKNLALVESGQCPSLLVKEHTKKQCDVGQGLLAWVDEWSDVNCGPNIEKQGALVTPLTICTQGANGKTSITGTYNESVYSQGCPDLKLAPCYKKKCDPDTEKYTCIEGWQTKDENGSCITYDKDGVATDEHCGSAFSILLERQAAAVNTQAAGCHCIQGLKGKIWAGQDCADKQGQSCEPEAAPPANEPASPAVPEEEKQAGSQANSADCEAVVGDLATVRNRTLQKRADIFCTQKARDEALGKKPPTSQDMANGAQNLLNGIGQFFSGIGTDLVDRITNPEKGADLRAVEQAKLQTEQAMARQQLEAAKVSTKLQLTDSPAMQASIMRNFLQTKAPNTLSSIDPNSSEDIKKAFIGEMAKNCFTVTDNNGKLTFSMREGTRKLADGTTQEQCAKPEGTAEDSIDFITQGVYGIFKGNRELDESLKPLGVLRSNSSLNDIIGLQNIPAGREFDAQRVRNLAPDNENFYQNSPKKLLEQALLYKGLFDNESKGTKLSAEQSANLQVYIDELKKKVPAEDQLNSQYAMVAAGALPLDTAAAVVAKVAWKGITTTAKVAGRAVGVVARETTEQAAARVAKTIIADTARNAEGRYVREEVEEQLKNETLEVKQKVLKKLEDSGNLAPAQVPEAKTLLPVQDTPKNIDPASISDLDRQNKYQVDGITTGAQALDETYPDKQFKVFSTKGSTAVIFEDPTDPTKIYKVYRDAEKPAYVAKEADNIRKLSEEDLAPKLYEFKMTGESPVPIVVMGKVDFSEDGYKQLTAKRLEEEITRTATILKKLNLGPGDVEFAVDNNTGHFISVDAGGFIPLDSKGRIFGQSLEQAVRENVEGSFYDAHFGGFWEGVDPVALASAARVQLKKSGFSDNLLERKTREWYLNSFNSLDEEGRYLNKHPYPFTNDSEGELFQLANAAAKGVPEAKLQQTANSLAGKYPNEDIQKAIEAGYKTGGRSGGILAEAEAVAKAAEAKKAAVTVDAALADAGKGTAQPVVIGAVQVDKNVTEEAVVASIKRSLGANIPSNAGIANILLHSPYNYPSQEIKEAVLRVKNRLLEDMGATLADIEQQSIRSLSYQTPSRLTITDDNFIRQSLLNHGYSADKIDRSLIDRVKGTVNLNKEHPVQSRAEMNLKEVMDLPNMDNETLRFTLALQQVPPDEIEQAITFYRAKKGEFVATNPTQTLPGTRVNLTYPRTSEAAQKAQQIFQKLGREASEEELKIATNWLIDGVPEADVTDAFQKAKMLKLVMDQGASTYEKFYGYKTGDPFVFRYTLYDSSVPVELDKIYQTVQYNYHGNPSILLSGNPGNEEAVSVIANAILQQQQTAAYMTPRFERVRQALDQLRQFSIKNGGDPNILAPSEAVDTSKFHIVSDPEMEKYCGNCAGVYFKDGQVLIHENAKDSAQTYIHEYIHRDNALKIGRENPEVERLVGGAENIEKLEEGSTEYLAQLGKAMSNSLSENFFESSKSIAYATWVQAIEEKIVPALMKQGLSKNQANAVIIESMLGSGQKKLMSVLGNGDVEKGGAVLKDILDQVPNVIDSSFVRLTSPAEKLAGAAILTTIVGVGGYDVYILAPQILNNVQQDTSSDTNDKTSFRIIPKVFAQEQEATPASVLKTDDFEQLIKKQLIKEYIIANGSIDTGIVNQIMALDVLAPRFYSNLDSGYSFITGKGGTSEGEIVPDTYAVKINPIPGVDLSAPERINLTASGSAVIAVGVHKGSGKVNPTKLSPIQTGTGSPEVSVIIFDDKNGNGKMDKDEKILPWAGVKVELSKLVTDQTVSLEPGWNLVTLTALPAQALTASGLISEIAAQGGYATTISTLVDGSWKSYVARGDKVFSNIDFALEPGKAYFVKSMQRSLFVFKGKRFDKPVNLKLSSGWNVVGFPKTSKAYTASTIIDAINVKKVLSDAIARFEAGLWDTFVKKAKEEYGNNFDIQNNRGYILRMEGNGGITP